MKHKGWLIFLTIFTYPLIVFSIIFLANTGFLKSSFYKNLLNRASTYQNLENVIKSSEYENELLHEITNNIDSSWIKTNIEGNLDIFFGYANSKTPSADFYLDIKPFKNELEALFPAELDLNIPDTLTFTNYKTFVLDLEKQASAFSSDELQINNSTSQIESINNAEKQTIENTNNVKTGLNYYRLISYAVLIFTVILLLLIILLAMNYPPGIFRYLGICLIYPAVSIIIVLIFLRELFLRWNWLKKIEMPIEYYNLSNDLYTVFIGDIIYRTIGASLIALFISLVLIIVSYIYGHYRPMPKKTTIESKKELQSQQGQQKRPVESINAPHRC